MKDSGVEWIGEIPESWEISKVRRGFRVSKTIAGDKANELPRLSLSNAGVLERPKYDGFGESPADYATYQIIPVGQFVFNFMGLEQDSLYRRVGISPMTGLVSAGYMEADYISTQINPEYAYYFFRFMENGLLFKQYGSGIRSNLNKQQFHNMPLLFPPLDEQARISAVIKHKVEAIDTIIAETQQSIDELKKYKQALITETVTKGLDKNVEMKDSGVEWIGVTPENWEITKLKYLSKISRGRFNHRPRNDPEFYSGEYPFIQTGEVARASEKISSYSQTLSEKGKEVSQEFKKGTIMMTIAANVGDVAILEFNSYAPDSLIGFSPSPKVNTKYLYYLLKALKNDLLMFSIISTQLNLNIDIVKERHIPFCSDKGQQNELVNYLDRKLHNIDSLIIEKQKIVNECNTYKQSLIYEYVTGKKEA
ncbi:MULTISPECIES: restriction endonuclease subunit S [Enterococcus]|nr:MULTISPECIES: restriction endonuclease subunit S [Enterococcus]